MTGRARSLPILALVLTLLFAALATPALAAPARPGLDTALRVQPAAVKATALAHHDQWRELWEDHILWTRMVILGILQDLPGTPEYAARLLQNRAEMGEALAPLYGADAAALGALIEEHLLIAVEILEAAKAGDAAALDDAVARWYANGEEIAAFMAGMNPRFWPEDEGIAMWTEHLDATLAEAVAVLEGDAAADVAAYDLVHELALEMADFFSTGALRQFPQAFTMSGWVRSGR